MSEDEIRQTIELGSRFAADVLYGDKKTFLHYRCERVGHGQQLLGPGTVRPRILVSEGRGVATFIPPRLGNTQPKSKNEEDQDSCEAHEIMQDVAEGGEQPAL